MPQLELIEGREKFNLSLMSVTIIDFAVWNASADVLWEATLRCYCKIILDWEALRWVA